MGVFIGQSTRIYDRERDEISLRPRSRGRRRGARESLPASNGKYSLACAVIVKRVDEQTRAKTSFNELLRATFERGVRGCGAGCPAAWFQKKVTC
jgi:2,3,4,5-tetrahydropyridine-2-carboxylate N-succinyltransferase